MCSFTWGQERDSELSSHNPIDFHMASPSQQEINCILDSFQRELWRQVLKLLRALLTLGNPQRWGCVLMAFPPPVLAVGALTGEGFAFLDISSPFSPGSLCPHLLLHQPRIDTQRLPDRAVSARIFLHLL